MWYVLIVILFGADPSLPPHVLEPVAFSTEDKCHQAGEQTLAAIKDAHLESIAAVAMACRTMSNPATEKDASQ
jgi:hypothetical protein